MDRLSPPKLAHLETLTRDNLPGLEAQRDDVREELTRAIWAWDVIRLNNRLAWLTEQIVYCKALPFSLDTDGER